MGSPAPQRNKLSTLTGIAPESQVRLVPPSRSSLRTMVGGFTNRATSDDDDALDIDIEIEEFTISAEQVPIEPEPANDVTAQSGFPPPAPASAPESPVSVAPPPISQRQVTLPSQHEMIRVAHQVRRERIRGYTLIGLSALTAVVAVWAVAMTVL